MSFVLLACSDIRAEKVNLEFPFSSPPPSIQVLRTVLEETFRQEEESLKQTRGFSDHRACEPFTISRLQRYDDDTQTWSEVVDPRQLQTYDQLYVFRKHTTKSDISTQRELPQPRRTPFFAASGVVLSSIRSPGVVGGGSSSSPQRQRPLEEGRVQALSRDMTPPREGARDGSGYGGSAMADRSMNAVNSAYQSYAPPSNGSGGPRQQQQQQREFTTMGQSLPMAEQEGIRGSSLTAAAASGASYFKECTTPERIEYLFKVGDQSRRGSLTFKNFESIFRMSNIIFPPEVVQDLHQRFARHVGGESLMQLSGFQQYAREFPVVINIAYQRLTNQDREQALHAAQRDTVKATEKAQQDVADLEARLIAARKALAAAEQRKAMLLDDLHELQRQRDSDYCRNEQRLLDKEVSVFRYRDRLEKEERDYEQLTMERRRRSVAAGHITPQLPPTEQHQHQQHGTPYITRDEGGGVVREYGFDDGRYGPG